MRVIAFWAGVAGLGVLLSQGAIVGISTLWLEGANYLPLMYQIAAGAQIVFSFLLVLFFFFYATKRDA